MNDKASQLAIPTPSAWTILARLNLLIGLERRILAIVASYAVAIGLLALIVPLTVQELVNTFAFAIQPIMIVTLVATMLAALLLMGTFRVLQGRAVEVLVQRIYTRLALAFTEALPRFRENVFLPQHTNTFIEAELLPRALVAMLLDFVNVSISGVIGMTILVMYHPYFLGYNILLIAGCAFVLTFLAAEAFESPNESRSCTTGPFTGCKTSVLTGSISNPPTASRCCSRKPTASSKPMCWHGRRDRIF